MNNRVLIGWIVLVLVGAVAYTVCRVATLAADSAERAGLERLESRCGTSAGSSTSDQG
jgi:hypothetical protein